MADVANKVIISKDMEVFVVAETTPGTLVFPAAADLVLVRDPGGEADQQLSRTPNDEIMRTRSRGDGFLDRTPAGTWRLPAYIRPSGTLGKAPGAGELLKAAWGAESIVDGNVTSGNAETYDLDDGETLTMKVDGGSEETATFNTGDFVDINAATAAEIVIVINTDIAGATASATSDGKVKITTDTTEGGSIQVTGGTANTALGFDTDLHTSYVKYAPAFDLPTVSIWVNEGEVVFAFAGAIVDEMKTDLVNKGGLPIEYAGQFAERRWAGKANVTTGCTTTKCVFSTEDEISRFCESMRVSLGGDDNSGAGYTISSVDYVNYEFTFSPALGSALNDGDLVAGFLPQGTKLGQALGCRTGTIEWNDVTLDIIALSLSLKNNAAYDDSEITSQGYPNKYFTDWRDITGSFDAFFMTRDVGMFRTALNNQTVKVEMGGGSTPATKVTIEIPKAQANFPKISGDAQRKKTIEFSAVRTDREDEASMVFGQP